MKCKDCKYFTTAKARDDGYGYCDQDSFKYQEPDPSAMDQLVYWDYEGYDAGFYVGPEFGCIHFQREE